MKLFHEYGLSKVSRSAAIGKFGPFQLRSFVILGFVYLSLSWAVLSISFLNAKTDYWCERPNDIKDDVSVERESTTNCIGSVLGYSRLSGSRAF